MADNVEIQGIEFQIVGETEKAASGLNNLRSILGKLKKATSGGLGLKAVLSEIKEINEAVGDSDSSELTAMATAIQTISSSAQQLAAVREHLKAMSEIDFSNLTEASNAISKMSAAGGLGRRGNSTRDTSDVSAVPNTTELDTEKVEGTTASIQKAKYSFDEAGESATKFFKNLKMQSVLAMSQTELLRAKIETLKAQLQDGIASGTWDDSKIASVAMKIQNLEAQLNKAASSGNTLKSALGTIKSALAGVGKTVTKELFKPFKQFSDQVKSTIAPIKRLVSSIGRIAMFRVIRSLFSGITQTLKEGIKNLYEYSKIVGTEFHKSMNSIATDALFLKNSFAAAVAPIINAIAPALDFLADKIASVLNLFAQLFAALSGKSVYTKAVKAQTEYADSISKAASSMKDFLADFDELNVFNPNSGSSSENNLPDFGSMFEEAKVDNDLWNFVERLREAIEAGDWFGLGKLLGDKVNEIVDAIPWDKIGTKIGKGINAVVQTTYSFLETVDFRNIGSKIAILFNNAIEEIDFNTAGRLMTRKLTAWYDTLIGFFETLDYALIGKSLGEFFRGAFDEAFEWIISYDWRDIGKKVWQSIKDFIVGFDFGETAKSFFRAFGAALTARTSLISGFVEDVIKDIAGYFKKFIEDENGDGYFGGIEIIKGLLKGMVEGIKNIAFWIWDNIFTPFVDGVKSAFQINSPSKVMIGIGEDIVAGLWQGIKDKIGDGISIVRGWAESVYNWFTGGDGNGTIFEKFKNAAGNIVNSFKDKINSTYASVQTSIITWTSKVKDWFTSSSFGGINSTTFGTYASNIVTSFKDKINSVYSTVQSSITTWASKVKDWFTGGSYGNVNATTWAAYANNVVTGFKDKINSAYTSVQTAITTWASKVKDWFTNSSFGGVNSTTFQNYAANVIAGFKDKITSGYTGVQSAMTSFASYVKSCFTNIVSYNSFYQVASDVISGFSKGIGDLYETCRSTISSWGSSIIDWFKTKLDSNSPSKVFEQIGQDTVLGYNIGLKNFGKTTKGVVSSWADSFTSIAPSLKFAVDTSALRYYTGPSFVKSISANVNTAFSAVDYDNGFERLIDFIVPTLGDMAGDLRRSADDMRRQADKKEQTIVQVGNRVISDAVTTQEQANGYRFVRA